MRQRTEASLRTRAPWRVLAGFGLAAASASRYARPGSVDELAELLARARAEGLRVAFRGAGRSYGDAATLDRGLIIDTTALNAVHAWDRDSGEIDAGPGVTIEDLWRRTLADGYWPAVVPGTMRPTLGGCLAMNVHGKNNYAAGPFGEHVRAFDLLTPDGTLLTCTPSSNADVFHAAIGGLGLLGAITRVRLALKRVETGLLRVEPILAGSMGEMLSRFDAAIPGSDYAVGWVDGTAPGRARGRGVIHRARYVPAADVPDAAATLRADRQDLPGAIFGVPRHLLWRLMRPAMFPLGVRVVNAAKVISTPWLEGSSYLQSHVGFAFLLDYVPDWRLAYGPRGFIQYQVFVPHAGAEALLASILERCQRRGRPPFLAVLKRHRPDAFLLSHAVDGWSLAMDFPVPVEAASLWRLTDELSDLVTAAGGRFYFAKDLVLRPDDVRRAYGDDRLRRFEAMKARLDPGGVLTTDLWERVTSRESSRR